jgi:CDP-glucose 4,6-dehydratase
VTFRWAGLRVLVTGHTGFKGSWLALVLHELGAEVVGLSLAGPPTQPYLFDAARLGQSVNHYTGDVRDLQTLTDLVRSSEPDVVLHLAAQPLVRASYDDPATTYATNVTGSVNVLEAARVCGVRGPVLVITSDKVYRESPSGMAHREDAPLGGADPYSGSKAAAEIAVASYVTAFSGASVGGSPIAPLQAPVATVRAGNVIGGGDWAADRLLPDLVRAAIAGEPLLIRSPDAVRPWQHVLDPICGYLRLAELLMASNASGSATPFGSWNFGPSVDDEWSVHRVADAFAHIWPEAPAWRVDERFQPRETPLLRLDSQAAREALHWQPRWDVATAIARTAAWYRAHTQGSDARQLMLNDVEEHGL